MPASALAKLPTTSIPYCNGRNYVVVKILCAVKMQLVYKGDLPDIKRYTDIPVLTCSVDRREKMVQVGPLDHWIDR